MKDGSSVELEQKTDYPWDGTINITLNRVSRKPFSLFLRIPSWCSSAQLTVNGKVVETEVVPGKYAEINRKWKKGDQVELKLPMKAKLIEANPLVEESRNQVAVQRGPVVYCLESPDMPENVRIFDIALPASIALQPKKISIANSNIVSLVGDAMLLSKKNWDKQLYREVSVNNDKSIPVRLNPLLRLEQPRKIGNDSLDSAHPITPDAFWKLNLRGVLKSLFLAKNAKIFAKSAEVYFYLRTLSNNFVFYTRNELFNSLF